MKTTILTCDSCDRGNDDDIEVTEYRINIGQSMDPSGNGYNIDWDYVDYCDDCYIRALVKHGEKIKKL